MSMPALASIGDHGVLNTPLSKDLSDVWIDRDLSWLNFNKRVLAEALDERTPLLEKAKFLAIFTSNLDEFFMRRVSVLRHGSAGRQSALLQELREKLLPMLCEQADCYRKTLVPSLAQHGVLLRRWNELTSRQQEEASDHFDSSISAALTPLVIDPEHPFPFFVESVHVSDLPFAGSGTRRFHVRAGEGSRCAQELGVSSHRSGGGSETVRSAP